MKSSALCAAFAMLAGCGSGDDARTGPDATPPDADLSALDPFSFFVTSIKAIREKSGSQDGFGGDLSYGETGPGAGLRGADKICTEIAEASMPGSGAKVWRAFLSVSADENGNQVNAIDRIGTGPWYDRLGRMLAPSIDDMMGIRPVNGDPAIANDFPNEDGVPNHDPDNTGEVDNHDMLTGTDLFGQLYDPGSTCNDWTASSGDASEGRPRVGHSWPREGGPGPDSFNSWMSSLDESGCAPGINLIETGPPDPFDNTVGSGGGYGGFYCFALNP